MERRKYRVLLVSSHPVPNQIPVFRRLATHPEIQPLVAYCALPPGVTGKNPEFLTKRAFNVPLLDGYPWTYVVNRSPRASLDRFFGLWNPGLVSLIRGHDCIVVYGYAYASLTLALITAKAWNKALILGTDATSWETPTSRGWRAFLKPWLYRWIFRLPDVVIVPSTASLRFLRSMGLSPDRIVVTPYVIDNDWFADRARLFDRTQIRQAWGIPPEALVVLFCAKFLPRKRPLDVIRAFAQADIEDAYLVLAGDGPLREQMADLCEKIGVLGKVKFIGIVPYSELPGVYSAADLLVVASSHEPWGLPVNEAMVCGTPVIVSDRVGARYDLVQEGETGFVYPCGDVQALAKIFREVLPDRERLKRMGEAARKRMKTWSPKENVEALVQAVEKAVQRKRGRKA